MSITFIHNGTLIDGLGGAPVPNAVVLIEDDRIVAAGPSDKIEKPNGELVELDAEKGFILPGLIDAHVHMVCEGFDIPARIITPFSHHFYRALGFMRRTLDAGITTVRDGGGVDFGIKQAADEGLFPAPRMQISVSVLTITGGHIDFWMKSGADINLIPPYPGYPGLCIRCDGVAEVRRGVREVFRAGAEVVKLCMTGGVLSPSSHPKQVQFSEEELAAMVDEAARHGENRLMAHAQALDGIKAAVRAGIHSIEHGIYLDDEVIGMMIERGTFLVPTLLAPIAVVEIGEATGKMPKWAVEKAKNAIEAHFESARKAYAAGVKIAMGTDAGVMPHGTNLRELGLLCKIGMSPMEALVAATKTAAECLGWEDRVGSIEAGKLADVVITRTDPLADITSLEDTKNVAVVLKGGKRVK